MAKVLIVNTLVGSLFIYKMSVLGYVCSQQIKRYDVIIHKFLWGGKKTKIPLTMLQKSRENRWLRLVDIIAKHKSELCVKKIYSKRDL